MEGNWGDLTVTKSSTTSQPTALISLESVSSKAHCLPVFKLWKAPHGNGENVDNPKTFLPRSNLTWLF